MYDHPHNCGLLRSRVRFLDVASLFAMAFFAFFGANPEAAATDHDICSSEALPAPFSITFIRSFRPGLYGPSRLAMDDQGDVLVADPARNQIVLRAPDGKVLEQRNFPTPPHAVAIGAQAGVAQIFYVGTDSGTRITAYSADWEPLFELGAGAGEFLAANDIAVDPSSGVVYVVDSDAHMIKMYGSNGAAIGGFGGQGSEPGLFHFPTAIAIDSLRNEVLVADQLNFRIQIFDSAGNFICRLGDANGANPGSAFFGTRARLFTVPQGVGVDDLGRIYVADAAEGRVRVTDRDGSVLAEIGAFGNAADRLRVPLDLVIDANGRVFISDSNNGRLIMYGIDSFSDPELFAPAQAVVSPDPFDRLGLDAYFEARVAIPGYRLSDVDLDSITANGVPADVGTVSIGDWDADGEPDLLARFDREALAATLGAAGQTPISIQGSVADMIFDATTHITVIGAVADGDMDGVTDDVDACLGTPPGAVIDETGCAIAQLCPCSAQIDGQPWLNHGDYVNCATRQSLRFSDARLIGRAEVGGMVVAAAGAACPGDGG